MSEATKDTDHGIWCCQKLSGYTKREVGAVPALPLSWELPGAPGCWLFSKKENEEGLPMVVGGVREPTPPSHS